jgi:hypothetical protein
MRTESTANEGSADNDITMKGDSTPFQPNPSSPPFLTGPPRAQLESLLDLAGSGVFRAWEPSLCRPPNRPRAPPTHLLPEAPPTQEVPAVANSMLKARGLCFVDGTSELRSDDEPHD